MFIEIGSKKKKAEIENIELENRQITFFLSDFFYLNFENDEEKNKFFSEFLKYSQKQYSEGNSSVELDDSLICESEGAEGVAVVYDTTLKVKSYIFTPQDNHLEISFSSGKEDLKFVLYKQIIDKIAKLV